ncbi:MAG: polysaccharide biosynthesis C-terminal domain-containing protein, partial [Pirellulaceae bacterium]
SVGFTMIAAVTHLASPLLFTWILRGKYDSGLHLMPLAFVHYTWFSLAVIASKYLICTDRARLGIIPLLISLVVCVTLTMVLAPRYGLIGIVTGSATASAVGLAALLWLTRSCGMPWERGVWISAILPLTLALGGGAAVAITAIVVLVSMRADWLINNREREQLAFAWHVGLEHLRHAGRPGTCRATPSTIACSVSDPPDRAH